MRFTTSDLAAATGGEVFGRDVEVDGVAIDSRLVRPGQVFVPVVAERDGHDFIGAALAGGAPAYFSSGPIEAGTAIKVPDTAAALTAVGRLARSRLSDRVVGITGSVGKTSVKDLLAGIARLTWITAASAGSFNNELGVPLTLANAPESTEVTVVEMGARGRGHIALLCEVARPTIGVVTVVAGAHLEQFGSLDQVATAKSELVAALPAAGTAVLNADDPRVAAMARSTSASCLTFGLGDGDVRATSIELGDDLRARFLLNTPWGSVPIHLGVAGIHQVANALAAAGAALTLGSGLDTVALGLTAGQLSAMRMDLTVLASGARLLDDAYNANPTSMTAALRSLAALPAARRFAVLGTMAELGADSAAAHREVAMEAERLGIRVLSVAEPAYGSAVKLLDSHAEAVDALVQASLGPDDAILVKGSRAAHLEHVVERIKHA